jgi:hypothetical protein
MTQAVMSIGDHKLDVTQSTLDQALEESQPERLSFRGAPIPSPMISRLPSVETATAIIAATATMRPSSRTFR